MPEILSFSKFSRISLLMFFLGSSFPLLSQVEVKKTTALKIDESIKIDGSLDEPAWDRAPEAGDFIQFSRKLKFCMMSTSYILVFSVTTRSQKK